jgi:hypothetical protein
MCNRGEQRFQSYRYLLQIFRVVDEYHESSLLMYEQKIGLCEGQLMIAAAWGLREQSIHWTSTVIFVSSIE